MIRVIYTDKAPKPIGPYSQGLCVNGWIYVSGQLPIDPKTGELVEGDFKRRTAQVLENVKSILEATGASLENIVKVTVYLKNINQIKELNEVYSEFFKDYNPARSIVEVSNLPRGADLEIDIVAYKESCV
ncbi:MAG: RidA family protein [Desulfurococcaceae archaeon]